MRRWNPQTISIKKMWGVTGQEADHPFQFQGDMSWVEVTYKIIIANLKYGAVRNLPQNAVPIFSERDMQRAAADITRQLFEKNEQGTFTYLNDFVNRFGDRVTDRGNFIRGLVVLRKIVFDFLGE